MASAAQLYALGLSKDQLAARVRAGWLHRVHRGVYAIGRRDLTDCGRLLAAVFACGPHAVASHGWAAWLWGILPGTEGVPHVTVTGRGGRKRTSRIVVHRIATLEAEEISEHRGIPVTTPPRTLLDLASVIGQRPLERAVDEAERLRLCSADDLGAVLDASRGRRGAGRLRRVLERHDAGPTLTRSELEERFLALCRQRRLAQPLVNAPLHGLTVDFLWSPERVVAEVDGRGSHGTRRAFQDDRDRDSLLAAHGLITLRFTWWDVTRRPAVVAHRVRRVLATRARR